MCHSRTTNQNNENSLEVQWSGLHAFTAKGLNSVPGWGTKILQGAQLEKKKKERKKERNLASLTFPSLPATCISR